MKNRQKQAGKFKRLHQQNHAFIIPNPWDIGSARVLAALGFEALASTSAEFAFTLGLLDAAQVSRNQMLAHCKQLCAVTSLPVSVDLENGYSDDT